MRQLNDKAAILLVPLIMSVIIAFCILFVGAYINGTIHSELEGNLGDGGSNSYNGSPQGRASATMNNTSWRWDSALDIVQVVIIITILAAAIGAIFLFTRFGG